HMPINDHVPTNDARGEGPRDPGAEPGAARRGAASPRLIAAGVLMVVALASVLTGAALDRLMLGSGFRAWPGRHHEMEGHFGQHFGGRMGPPPFGRTGGGPAMGDRIGPPDRGRMDER